MFDIGVSELFVIGVVALVVIGPEKLPRVARTIGHLTGRLQRYVNDVKADINREIELDELRRFKQEVEKSAQSFESTIRSEFGKTESELNQAAQQLADPLRAELNRTEATLAQAADHIREAADPPSQPLPAPADTALAVPPPAAPAAVVPPPAASPAAAPEPAAAERPHSAGSGSAPT